jgi:hypothetical protein
MRKKLNPRFKYLCKFSGFLRLYYTNPEAWAEIKNEAPSHYLEVKIKLIAVLSDPDKYMITTETRSKVYFFYVYGMYV